MTHHQLLQLATAMLELEKECNSLSGGGHNASWLCPAATAVAKFSQIREQMDRLGDAVLRVKRGGHDASVKREAEGGAVSVLGSLLKGSFQGLRLIRSYS